MKPVDQYQKPVEELVSIYQRSGDPGILEKIIDKNKRLLFSIAKKYKNPGHDFEDLMQMAYTGLLVAVNRYKIQKKNKFSTFAYYCINGEILHNLRDNDLIRIPRWLQKLNTVLNRFVRDFKAGKGRYPTREEISSGINISLESVDEILRAREATLYNGYTQNEHGNDEEIIDRSLIRSRSPKSFELVMEDRITLWDAIDRLKSLNKKILVLKYFFGLSQEEIGRKTGLSQRTVSRKLKDSLEEIGKDFN